MRVIRSGYMMSAMQLLSLILFETFSHWLSLLTYQ